MGKEKKELELEDIYLESKNIDNMLKSYEKMLDTNYQTFLKTLLSEVRIIGLISTINDKKLNQNKKERITSIKKKFYEKFLDALESVNNHFSDTNSDTDNNIKT